MPRYLTVVDVKTFSPSMSNGRCSWFRRVLTMCLHFFGLSFVFHCCVYYVISLAGFWTTIIAVAEWDDVLITVVSSAKMKLSTYVKYGPLLKFMILTYISLSKKLIFFCNIILDHHVHLILFNVIYIFIFIPEKTLNHCLIEN